MDFASVGDGTLGASIIFKSLSELPETGRLASPLMSVCLLENIARWERT